MKTIIVISSNGELIVDATTGDVIECNLFPNGEAIDEIKRFDLEEYKDYYGEIHERIDILNLGYWMGCIYEPADFDWRRISSCRSTQCDRR